MQMLADLVAGRSCADVGTDHGLIPIWLEKSGRCDKLILTDIAEGPLGKARQNIEAFGSSLSDLRLGAGLKPLEKGEADTVIIAGMGGELIASILTADLEKTRSFRRFVLQPRSREGALRAALEAAGLPITGEHLVCEAGRVCQVIVCEPSSAFGETFEAPEDYEIAPLLFEARDPLLAELVERRLRNEEKILAQLSAAAAGLPAEKEFHQHLAGALRAMKEKL